MLRFPAASFAICNKGSDDVDIVKKILKHIFIDGLSGMALGLFATLIFGTILAQIGSLVDGPAGGYITAIATVAKILMGAGIGAGISVKFKAGPLVTASVITAGMIGSFATAITAFAKSGEPVSLSGVGEPLGAFIAAFVAVEIGNLISGKTKLDILLTPACTVLSGCAAGLLLGPPISRFMTWLGEIIMWGTEQQPLLMGIVVSVLMGIILTLPISSAALAIILGLSGLAGGAACVGCCAQMVGFAVISYRENGFGGLLAQGIGTSMLQVPNLMKKPLLWIPPVVTSAILGPIATTLFKITCLPAGAGMGTSGLVGPIMTYQSMLADGADTKMILIEMAIIYVVAPACISLGISEGMRKAGLIKPGDLSLKEIN